MAKRKATVIDATQEKPGKGFDLTKDALLAHIGDVKLTESKRLTITVRSYSGGEPKISIVRAGDDWVSPNIGRLTALQAAGMAKLVVKAVQWVNDPQAAMGDEDEEAEEEADDEEEAEEEEEEDE